MAGVLQNPDGRLVAECEHCGPVCERSLEAGELDADENREIVAAVAWNHAHYCGQRPDGGEPVDVTVSAAVRGESS